MRKKAKVLTHDGIFHADEVFAIAIIKLFYSDVEVIRSRKITSYEDFDFVIDVGRKYDEEKRLFDHHQKDFYQRRLNGVPYASAGLILRFLYKDQPRLLEYLDEKIIQGIDAHDNAFTSTEENPLFSKYTISQIISSFNPTWDSKRKPDEAFAQAIDCAFSILKREISRENAIFHGESIVRSCIRRTTQDYVILPTVSLPFKPLIEESYILFAIMQEKDDKWVSVAIPVKEKGFLRKKYFPKEWGGLDNDELERVSGVKGAIFCHKDLFICGATTKQGIIKLTEYAIKTQKLSQP